MVKKEKKYSEVFCVNKYKSKCLWSEKTYLDSNIIGKGKPHSRACKLKRKRDEGKMHRIEEPNKVKFY